MQTRNELIKVLVKYLNPKEHVLMEQCMGHVEQFLLTIKSKKDNLKIIKNMDISEAFTLMESILLAIVDGVCWR